MIAYIGGECQDRFAPLWYERPIPTSSLMIETKRPSNLDRAARFAVKCEEALAFLSQHPSSRADLAKAMGWHQQSTWTVLERLKELKLVRHVEGDTKDGSWLYKAIG